MLTVGSLFSGAGGFDIAAEMSGMQVIWQVEKSEIRRSHLERWWPAVERFEDVHEVGAHNLRAVDVIIGGPPCPPVSTAGKRRGQDDDRWLWPQMRRVIEELEPTWVCFENVPGILTLGIDVVLDDLGSAGYETGTLVFPVEAQGANHIRYRAFVVAYSESARSRRLPVPARDQKEGPDAHWGAETACTVANSARERPHGSGVARGRWAELADGAWWQTEPDVCRVDDGSSKGFYKARIEMLGDMVIPRQALPVLKAIAQIEEQ